MRIVHLCLACFYVDGYSYQENMLPKYHKALGHEVSIVASLQTYDNNGHLTYLDKPEKYVNEYGIPVYRIDYRTPYSINRVLRRYDGTYGVLEEIKPDVIFIHGLQFLDVSEVIRYKRKHERVVIFVDNHADFKNSAKGFLSRNLMHRGLWRIQAHKLLPYTEKYYGVLPARVDFLKNVYKLPAEKVALLPIGANDELVEKYSTSESRKKTRFEYGYTEEDIVIVTGGKINSNRPETLDLMKALIECDISNVRLLIYGIVDNPYKAQFEELCKSDRIQFIGWISAERTYEIIAASDLVAFPGLHSVMWEQSVAQGKPCLFREIPGFDHVDIGGNAYFCRDVSKEGLLYTIDSIFRNPEKYEQMKRAALSENRKQFYYSVIAKKSIEVPTRMSC